jgi:hypothetical protein
VNSHKFPISEHIEVPNAVVSHHWSMPIPPEYTLDMLTSDIDNGRAQLVLDRVHTTLEKSIHASHDESLVRLSQALQRHPAIYASNVYDEENRSELMKTFFNKFPMRDVPALFLEENNLSAKFFITYKYSAHLQIERRSVSL